MHIDELYKLFLQYPQVETDSRKLIPGALFFALKGPNFNGNHFIQQALDAGAAYCVVDEAPTRPDNRIILVNNSLESLQQLAKKHREHFDIPFIAITGSNGKTTTKELVQEVLATTYRSYTTQGNLNNHIGIPLTLLRVKQDAEIAVIEMGANHQGEIAGYCEYAMPTHGLITNCGKAHLEGFGGEEGVRKAKGELFDWLRKTGGTAFINTDQDYLQEMSRGISSIITYGTETGDYTGRIADDHELLEVSITKGAQLPAIKTRLVGSYNLPNVLSAVCVGKTFKVNDERIREALENYTPSNSRSQLIEMNGNRIILDAYNANPTSMKAAIENFARMDGAQKVLILGGMMELGNESLQEHQAIVDLIRQYNWYKVVLAGKDYINLPGEFYHFDSSLQIAEWFHQQHFTNVQVLIKGSRSMEMEKVIK